MGGKVLILGIGNLLWADEGFGVRVVQALQRTYEFPDPVSLLDGGTQGLGLVPYVQAADILIIVDAVDFRLEPGVMIQLQDEDVPAYFGAKKMSLHQVSFQEVLSLSRLLGKVPESLYLIGVQPEILDDYGGSLSSRIKSRIQDAVDAILSILSSHGITPRQISSSPAASREIMDMEDYESLRPSADDACRFGDSRFLTPPTPDSAS